MTTKHHQTTTKRLQKEKFKNVNSKYSYLQKYVLGGLTSHSKNNYKLQQFESLPNDKK